MSGINMLTFISRIKLKQGDTKISQSHIFIVAAIFILFWVGAALFNIGASSGKSIFLYFLFAVPLCVSLIMGILFGRSAFIAVVAASAVASFIVIVINSSDILQMEGGWSNIEVLPTIKMLILFVAFAIVSVSIGALIDHFLIQR